VPVLKAIAPTQASPVFGLTQLVVMAIFIVLTVLAFKRFHGAPSAIASGDGLSVEGATRAR
jgi:hypothetical protein